MKFSRTKTRSTASSTARAGGCSLLAVGVLLLSACATTAPAATPPTPAASGTASSADAALRALLPERITSSGKIRVAMSPTGNPFSMKPADTFEGMLPEMSEAVGNVLGVEMEIVETSYASYVPALQAGRVDMIWGALGDTVEREKTIDFVSYLRSSSSPMVSAARPVEINTAEDLCGLVAGTVKGGDIQTFLEAQQKECTDKGLAPMELNLYDSASAATAQLQAGKVATFLGVTTMQRYIAKTAGDGKTFDVLDLKVIPTIYGMGFSKNDPDLQKAMAGALQKLINDGTYASILDKYDARDAALEADDVMINGVGAGRLP
jgi:polar amino acid transport system substrate-binding protein